MKLRESLLLALAALAMTACFPGGGVDSATKPTVEKPGDHTAPSGDEGKKDVAGTTDNAGTTGNHNSIEPAPDDLKRLAIDANTVDGMNLLENVNRAGERLVSNDEREWQLIGGEWSTAIASGTDAKFQGLATSKTGSKDLGFDKAKYKGVALGVYQEELGKLEYEIDFATRKGQGRITGINRVDYQYNDVETIKLKPAKLQGSKGSGVAVLEFRTHSVAPALNKATDYNVPPSTHAPNPTMNYSFGVYGPKAEEIAGRLENPKGGENSPPTHYVHPAPVIFHGRSLRDDGGKWLDDGPVFTDDNYGSSNEVW